MLNRKYKEVLFILGIIVSYQVFALILFSNSQLAKNFLMAYVAFIILLFLHKTQNG